MTFNWKYRILNGWHFMRVIRLALGIIVLIEAIRNYDLIMASLGAIFFLQAGLNVGCCGISGCDVEPAFKETRSNTTEDITYKEIK